MTNEFNRLVFVKDAFECSARSFAIAAHASIGQVRKYTGEPYDVHLLAVVKTVASVPHTPYMIAAAWLHDVVEDTRVTHALIEYEFGPEVAALVAQLTDVSRPEDGNRAARKKRDREHLAQASPEAQTIKLADLIDNTRSIVKYDPEFATVYLAEKSALLDVLTKGDPKLYKMATESLLTGLERIAT